MPRETANGSDTRPWLQGPGSAGGFGSHVSPALRRIGLAAWLVLGIAALMTVGVAFFAWTAGIIVPFFFAALFGAVVFPLVDRLERWHVPRWVAALLMVVLAIALIVLLSWVIVDTVIQQWPEIKAGLNDSVAKITGWLDDHGVQTPSTDEVSSTADRAADAAAGGLAATLGNAISVVAEIGFGVFLGLNILFWIAKDGRLIGRWVGRHMWLPDDVGVGIVKGAVHTLQRYFLGVTFIAALNGAVVWAGAAIIGIPLAMAIALVTFAFAYIPYIGAIIGGAFAVLLALASGGSEDAAAMLVVVILANGPIQNVAQQFVIGDALKMHPLSILVITTTGGIVGGAIGSMVAAPFAKVLIDAKRAIDEAGVFVDAGRAEESPRPPGDLGPPSIGADT